MEKKRKALGKGLGALLSTHPAGGVLKEGKSYLLCPIEKIRPNRFQPRKVFSGEKLAELASSIREKGILQPLIVRSDGDDGYELIAGERRWRAAQKAALREVPVIVKNVSDEESLELAIIENIQRADLNPIEEAEGYKRLMDEFSYTQEDMALKVGKERATISNHLRILRLPDDVKEAIAEGLISLGHAKALLSLEKTAHIKEATERIIRDGLSVRKIEAMVKSLKSGRSKKRPASMSNQPEIKDIEKRLSSFFGTKVKINRSGKKGKVEVDFYSDDDLDRLIELLGI